MIEDELLQFDKSMNEFRNKYFNTLNDTSGQMMGLRDTYKDSMKAFAEKLVVKLKEEERMVEMVLEYKTQLSRQNEQIVSCFKNKAIATANKAVGERLKRLQKSADVYKDRLGLEIRKIYGDKLQFVFTNIDPKDPDSPFMFSLKLNEARDYEVSDSSPHLECLAELQENLRKTKNFSAFLANVRKAFVAMVYNA
ncbi:kinetochore protein Spc25 [Echinops telfairi]|uniref:Kinetochore protein Spc25 n=1 Tax=Echinops telfairi TaxID=9371 RepID=A0AC55DQA2_ECHTE|nr:kinetochore protein Spc25 [Echinops telfairi]